MRKQLVLRSVAIFVLLNIIVEVASPSVAYALSTGPVQPEVSGFEQADDSDMVDLFSGDFTYNIPLLDVDGYPINMSYHSGRSMDEESSWVGLGWSLSPGAISREVRGLPDDFNGDKVTKELNIKPNKTYSIKFGAGTEFVGIDRLKVNTGLAFEYNNYTGFSISKSIGLSFTVAKGGKNSKNSSQGKSASNELNLGFSASKSSTNGISISPNVSFEKVTMDKGKTMNQVGSSVSTSFNSRTGLSGLTLSGSKSDFYYKSQKSKAAKISGSGNNGFVSFSLPTYTPYAEVPYRNISGEFAVKFGPTANTVDVTYNVSGAYSQQYIPKNKRRVSTNSYGYLNLGNAYGNRSAGMDYNREKDGSFSKNTPNLAVPFLTYDLYSISGQGVGGMFRPFRKDIGFIYDPNLYNESYSFNLGLELGLGNVVKYGGDFMATKLTSRQGGWYSGNAQTRNKFESAPGILNKIAPSYTIKDKPGYGSNKVPNINYEAYYFKELGETNVYDKYLYEDLTGKSSPVSPTFQGSGHNLSSNLFGQNLATERDYKERIGRNKAIYFLSAAEAQKFGIRIDPVNDKYILDQLKSVPAHHAAEYTVLQPDGRRYVYGLPAYNLSKQEVSFAVSKKTLAEQLIPELSGSSEEDVDPDGLYRYAEGENSGNNKSGLDHFFTKISTPAYAHSYLLTAILSPDYVDLDKTRGPSPGDFGTYVIFNYKKPMLDEVAYDFKWRTPLGENSSNLNKGLYSLNDDQRANYIYGERQQWYLDEIVTKKNVAKFETSDREDGFGVEGENGKVDFTKPLKKLDRIVLYGLNDYKKDKNLAVKIKTVNFEYDYSLCKNLPNNVALTSDDKGSGKLTLKKLYFTYQSSNRSRFSPYSFEYGDGMLNPDYHIKKSDRWGNFKDIDLSSNAVKNIGDASDFPYVQQNSTIQNQYASAWEMKKIVTPSGSEITVELESDDYAYVQDRPAMQLFSLKGFSQNSGDEANDNLYSMNDAVTSGSLAPRLYMHIDLKDDADSPITDLEFKQKYLRGMKDIRFQAFVQLGPNSNLLTLGQQNTYDYVSGYFELDGDNVTIKHSDNSNTAIIKMKKVPLGDNAAKGYINPIAKAAMQYCRLNNPRLAFMQASPQDGALKQVVYTIANMKVGNLISFLLGPNLYLKVKGYCQRVKVEKSFVRLYNPNGCKLGGGSRVKEIRINDNFEYTKLGNTGKTSIYGKKYKYETENESGATISSGVAAYEPILGSEENPWRTFIPFGNKREKLLAPDDKFYMEGPLGECFFPGASVGYSKVEVKSIGSEGEFPSGFDNLKIPFSSSEKVDGDYSKHKTGKTVFEFYTAKDFPVKVSQTGISAKVNKSNWLLKLFKIANYDYGSYLQGYVVETNDMHGKPKSTSVYAEGQKSAISSVEYKYKVDKNNRLDNKVKVMDRMGHVEETIIGLDEDFVSDFREHRTDLTSVGLNGNLAVFMAAILPVPVPTILPAYSKEETVFKSGVTSKHFNRKGILESVIVTDNLSKVTTSNEVYDKVTGNVLLTKVLNDFNDPVYQMSMPSHWAYNGLGPAYKNIMYEFKADLGENGKYYLDTDWEKNLFAGGEEIIILWNQGFATLDKDNILKRHLNFKFFILREKEVNGSREYFKIVGGDPEENCKIFLKDLTYFKVIRSGRRNQQSAMVGGVSSRLSMINANSDLELNQGKKILNVSASTYTEDRGSYCFCEFPYGTFNASTNPYFSGIKGVFSPKETFVYQGLRISDPNAKVREGGHFASFHEYWKKPVASGSLELFWKQNPSLNTFTGASNIDKNKWVKAEEIVRYDLLSGMPVESKDALGISTASYMRHKNTLPTITVNNAAYNEVVFDGFEEYDNNNTSQIGCKDLLYTIFKSGVESSDFPGTGVEVEKNSSHSGKKSIKVKANNEAKLKINIICAPKQ